MENTENMEFDDPFDTIFMDFMESSSSSEVELLDNGSHGGSMPGKRPNKRRNFEKHHEWLMDQYFRPDSVYCERDFVRRFRMKRSVFDMIFTRLQNEVPEFQHRRDCTGKLGISPLIKLTACLRILGYGDCMDRNDENLGIAFWMTSWNTSMQRTILLHQCQKMKSLIIPYECGKDTLPLRIPFVTNTIVN